MPSRGFHRREVKKGVGDEIPRQIDHRDRSLPPVAETGRRSVGNRKERLRRDYAGSPGRQPYRHPDR